MKVVILEPALEELSEARDYYLNHASSRIAGVFLDEFEYAVRRLTEYPNIGTPLTSRQRILPLRRFPYSVIYRLSAETIVISAVANQRRRPGYWRQRG